jgi:hypothetical protein
MGQSRKIPVVRLVSGENPGQHQIKNSPFVVQGAGRNAHDWQITPVGQKKHGSR